MGFLHSSMMQSESSANHYQSPFPGSCNQDTCTSLCVLLPYKPCLWVPAPSHGRHKLLSSPSMPSMSCLWLTFFCDDPAPIISLCFLLHCFELQYLMSGPCCKYLHKRPITSLPILFPLFLYMKLLFFS